MRTLSRPASKRVAVAAGFVAAAVALTAVWAGWILRAPHEIDGSFPVNAQQEAAARRLAAEHPGPDSQVARIQLVKDGTGGSPAIRITSATASMEFSWPDERRLRMAGALPVAPVSEVLRVSREAATTKAEEYMLAHFPRAREATRPVPPAANGETGM
ncbi:hypothetical protein ACTVZO_37070 [Streptomyces sp. IBSNAI002]|uniref:hypothetical protein n=1 Tax=Streptomyces sp. IBSNAI002 TaxID=3457500 RepID=UPI003FCF0B94